jgi:hypothetical protein
LWCCYRSAFAVVVLLRAGRISEGTFLSPENTE